MTGRNIRLSALVLILGMSMAIPCARAEDEADAAASGRAVGDTLTVVMRPILSVPAIAVPGGSFTIEALASPSTTDWAASLTRDGSSYPLTIGGSSYVSGHERWFLTATLPSDIPAEVYALEVSASGGIFDEVDHAVGVRQSIDSDFYFVHITDTHLPTHLYYYQQGADTDTSEMVDLRMVINDINIINPAFVVLTGDVVNEGELEDFLDKRYYTRTQRLLQELDVPVYLSAGNHDIGGWDDSPPSDGTARRNWWKFFGWPYLDDPPPDDIYTQNYSFDYGGAHFIALEAYNNYDRWRRSTYGTDSFTSNQLDWLYDDIDAVPAATPIVAFYHKDFQDQLNVGSLGVDGTLWGHVHYSSGDVGDHPFDLSTGAVCDGNRNMRLVRVSGQTVTPGESFDTGSIGRSLYVTYDSANDGSATENAVSIANNNSQAFEHAQIKFRMDAASAPYEVDVGEITQTLVDGDVAVCYVSVVLPASSNTYVTITSDTAAGIDGAETPALALAGPAFPNPAGRESTMSFTTAAPGMVSVDIFDVAGRHVARAFEGRLDAGPHAVRWDARDRSGDDVGGGIYLYRITTGDESVSGKLVVLR